MNPATTQRMANLLGAIREATAWPTQRAAVLEECARLLPVDYLSVTTATLFPPEPGTTPISTTRLGSLRRVTYQDRDGMEESYFAGFYAEDPYIAGMKDLSPSYQEFERLANGVALRRSSYYNDFLVPYDLTRTARVVVPTRTRAFCALDLNWDRPGGRVGESERQLAVMIAGQIAASIEAQARSAGLDGTSDLALRHADLVREAAFLLEADRRVHDRNAHADDLLDADGAFAVRHGRLVLRDDAAHGRLCRILSATNSTPHSDAVQTPLVVPSTIGPVPYHARILARPRGGPVGPGPLALLLVPLGARLQIERKTLRAPLTQRERHSMLALLELDSEEAAAAALGVTLNTLRTHRKNGYSKLGVSSRRELAEALQVADHGRWR